VKKTQDKIKQWNDERGWSDYGQVKDLLLNMTEEVGEMWNLIKWVDVDTQKKLIKENKEEVENFIADMLYLSFKISYICDVDPEKAMEDVMKEYDKRFPLDKSKGNHGNTRAGGIDQK
jgi:dCTP diphosphatase